MKILIVNMTRMGDLIQTTPLIAGLKAAHPGYRVALLANQSFVEICALIPHLDALYTFDFDRTLREIMDENLSLADNFHSCKALIDRLKAEHFDMVINLTHSKVSAVLVSMLNAPDVRGLALSRDGYRVIRHPWLNYFFNATLNREINRFNLVDIYSRSGDVEDNGGRLLLEVPDEDRAFAADLFGRGGVKEGDWVVGFQPGASRSDRLWPAERFAAVGDLLTERYGAKIVLFGAPGEKPLGQAIRSGMRSEVIDAIGRTNLGQLAALTERCSVLVTNDTGTMHIATAMGAKILGLFLATARCVETGPYGEGHIVIEPEIPCRPCSHQVECIDPVCLDYVTVDHVLAGIEALRCSDRHEPPRIGAGDFSRVRFLWSAFDEHGLLEFIPLLAKPITKWDFFFDLYRAMWLRTLKGEEIPQSQEPCTAEEIAAAGGYVAERLLQRYDCSDREAILAAIVTDLEAFSALEGLARHGTSMSSDLLQMAMEMKTPVAAMKQIGDALVNNDDKIRNYGLIHAALRPITMKFIFGKENLEGNEIVPLTTRTLGLYQSLQRESEFMVEAGREILLSIGAVESSDRGLNLRVHRDEPMRMEIENKEVTLSP